MEFVWDESFERGAHGPQVVADAGASRPAPGKVSLVSRLAATGQDARARGLRPTEPPAGDLAVARQGIRGNGAPLPYLDQLRSSFGSYQLGDVRGHVGDDAAAACEQLDAIAYATGTHVAFKRTPDLHTAAHEAAHVVQQAAGAATSHEYRRDARWERHADQVADAVVAGRSAEPILASVLGAPGATGRSSDTVQCKSAERDSLQRQESVDNSALQPVHVQEGELVKAEAASEQPLLLEVRTVSGELLARDQGVVVRVEYLASQSGPVRVHVRPIPDGIRPTRELPAARVSISVEPGEAAASSSEGDGAVHFNRSQQRLLGVFGIDPRGLHPQSALSLVQALEVLEIWARQLARDPDGQSAVGSDYSMVIEHQASADGEHVLYRLDGKGASLTLATSYRAGVLRCRLSFFHGRGITLEGRLVYTPERVDDVSVMPTANPLGAYIARDQAADDEIDDFSDVVAPDAPARRSEGLGSFVEGAVGGDYANNDSWSAAAGQVGIGLVPIAGQIADARDISAAAGDVLDGRPGAWGTLGISIIAVIPGLDFLKGGSRAGRKTLREASSGAIDGTTRAALKRIGRTISKRAAQRAEGELRVLATGRAELLARLDHLLVEEAIDEATKNSVRRARNAFHDHLQSSDLSGALRDRLGLPVRKKNGRGTWDHLREVEESLDSLDNSKANLLRQLRRMEKSSRAHGRLAKDIDAISEMQRRIKKFLEIH